MYCGIIRSTRKASFRVALLSTALCCSATVSAAETPTSDEALNLTTEAAALEELVVTARRVEENLQSVPVAVTALSGNDLAERGVQRVLDLQTQVPNLYLQKGNSDHQAITLSIRGQRQSDILLSLDPSVGIYIDSVNKPHSLGLMGALVDVSRVEVLRGPQGTLYGRNTTGGALSIYTNDPVDDLGGSLEATVGNYDAWNVLGIANLPVADGLAVRVAAQRGKRSGYASGFFGQDLNNDDSQFYRIKARAELGSSVVGILSLSYQQNDTSGSAMRIAGLSAATASPAVLQVVGSQYLAEGGAVAGLPAALGDSARIVRARETLNAFTVPSDFRRTAATSPNFSNFHATNLSLNIDADISNNVSVRSITGYAEEHRSTALDLDGTPYQLTLAYQFSRSKFLSQELQVIGDGDVLSWVVGAYASSEAANDSSLAYPIPLLASAINPSFIGADLENRSKAVFAQTNWQVAPRIALTMGYRYSEDTRILVSSSANRLGCVVPAPSAQAAVPGQANTQQCPRTFENKFAEPSWLASLSYEPNDALMAYAKVARGYRSGGQNLRGNTTAASFAPFDPETVTEYEVGLKSEWWGRRVRANLALYYDDYQNIQRSAALAAPNGATITLVSNAARGTIQGIEAEVTVQATDRLRLNGAYGLTDAEYQEFRDLSGDRSGETFGVPETTATIGVRYALPTRYGDLLLTADYHWQSDVVLAPDAPTSSQVTQEDYGILNSKVTLRMNNVDAEVSIFAYNILDEEYYASAVSLERALGYNTRQLGDPRVYGLQFKKKFGAM